MRTSPRSTWCALGALTLAMFSFMGGCGSNTTKATTKVAAAPKPPEDFVMQATDFTNLHDMTPVRGFFVDNKLGHLEEAVAMATANKGGEYPVGTIFQLVPQEAMIKRHPGFNPKTKDWEFFFLTTDATGTKIAVRGAEKVVNRFGGHCASCHALAKSKFDFVCEKDHGCEPLPIGDDVIHVIQEADNRPRATKS